MEADWEIEIGGDAPVMEGQWAGFVDLRETPERATELPETRIVPGLADALRRLNAPSSPMWSSKCDAWTPAEFDPDELDAHRGISTCAMACYVDLFPRGDPQWRLPEQAIEACKRLCSRLKAVPLRACRADLVVRRAPLAQGVDGVGISAYLTACGATESDATTRLGMALAVLARSIVSSEAPEGTVQSYNENGGE